MRVLLRRAVVALLALAVAAGVIWSLLPQPVPVETATVTRGRFVATVDDDGKTRIRERYVVAAPLAGRLTRIRLKPGDAIKADQRIATIVPSPAPLLDPRARREAEERVGAAEAALERARAMVERAQVQAVQARADLERTRVLAVRGIAATQALERAEMTQQVADRDLRAAEFQRHAAQHELDQARALLARYDGREQSPGDTWTVTAPVSGLVLKVMQESETIVQPGTALMEIGDPHDLELVIDVLSTDAVEIRPGAEVAIEHWGGSGALKGRVRLVEPAAFTKVSTLGVEEQRVNVIIDVVSPLQERAGLGDAFQVDARITVFTEDDAIIAPSGALFRQQEQWQAYVVVDGRAERRPITVLRRSGQSAAIGSGLAEGDMVIVYPTDRVAPGVRVQATRRQPKP